MADQLDGIGTVAQLMSGIRSGKNGRITMTQNKKLDYQSGAS